MEKAQTWKPVPKSSCQKLCCEALETFLSEIQRKAEKRDREEKRREEKRRGQSERERERGRPRERKRSYLAPVSILEGVGLALRLFNPSCPLLRNG